MRISDRIRDFFWARRARKCIAKSIAKSHFLRGDLDQIALHAMVVGASGSRDRVDPEATMAYYQEKLAALGELGDEAATAGLRNHLEAQREAAVRYLQAVGEATWKLQ